VLTPLLQPELPDVHQLPQASSLCGACQAACPVRIAIPELLLRLRADAVSAGHADPVERAAIAGWKATMLNPRMYRMSGWLAARATRLIGRKGRIRRLPPPLSAWTRRRDFPTFAATSFQELWEQRSSPAQPPV
jgi:L-lactate dehydrogenase complex protein LldF